MNPTATSTEVDSPEYQTASRPRRCDRSPPPPRTRGVVGAREGARRSWRGSSSTRTRRSGASSNSTSPVDEHDSPSARHARSPRRDRCRRSIPSRQELGAAHLKQASRTRDHPEQLRHPLRRRLIGRFTKQRGGPREREVVMTVANPRRSSSTCPRTGARRGRAPRDSGGDGCAHFAPDRGHALNVGPAPRVRQA